MRSKILITAIVVAGMISPAILAAQDRMARPDSGNGQGRPSGAAGGQPGRPGGNQGGARPQRPGGGGPGNGAQPGGGGRPDHPGGGPGSGGGGQPGRPGGHGPGGRPDRPGGSGPGNGGGVRPGRPGGGFQPGRPGNGGPQIQPIRPGFGGQRPPHNGGGFHRPPSYRPAPYRYPRGYGYRRWQIGSILPSILFGSSFYFNDYAQFGLYSPPHYYRWVRYGPDLVLVNVRNGHVRDVRYNVFG